MRKLFIVATLCAVCALGQNTIEKAKALYDEKKYSDAEKLLKTVDEKQATYAASRYYLGRIAFDQKKYDDAEEYLEEAVELDPNVADYHFWYGNVLGNLAQDANVLKQGMLAPKIKSEFEETARLDPKNIEAWWGLINFYTQAPGFMGGSYEKAFEMAATISKLDAAEGHRARAVIYTRQEKMSEAEAEYLAAYKAKPQLVGQVVNFYVREKKYDQAFKLAEDASVKDPTNMSLTYLIGRTSAVSGQRLDRGEECLKKYLAYQPKQNEPSHGGAHMRLGQIYEKRGTKAEAKKCYEAAVKLDPTLKEAQEGLARVSK